jgi:transposase
MAFRKPHRYLTIVNDVDRGTVEFVAKGGKKLRLTASYDPHIPEQFAGIEAVAMDMGEPSIQATREAVPRLFTDRLGSRRCHAAHERGRGRRAPRKNRLLNGHNDDALKGTSCLWTPPKRTSVRSDEPIFVGCEELI